MTNVVRPSNEFTRENAAVGLQQEADRTETSWDASLQAYLPRLRLFARQWVHSREDAEDVVQEALSRFWEHERLTIVDLLAYLFVCVKNSAMDFLKSCYRRDKLRQHLERARPTTWQLFECPLEQEERRKALEGALQRLPLKQREVLVMRIWGGLTFAQIAQVLNASPNTVASRYRYALTTLRGTLAKEWVS